MNQWLGVLRSPRGCIVRAVIAGGQSDPELIEEFRKRFLRPRRQEAYQTLRRGIERGELPRDLDLDLVLDTALRRNVHALPYSSHELSERYVEEVCRIVLQGATCKGPARGENGAKLRSRLNVEPKLPAALRKRA